MKLIIEATILWNCVCFALTHYAEYGVPTEIPPPKWYLNPCHSTFRIPHTTAAMQNWITYIYEANPYRIKDECIFIFEGDPDQRLDFELKEIKIYFNETHGKECLSLYNVKDDANINITAKFCVSEENNDNDNKKRKESVFSTDTNIGIITTTIKFGYFQIRVRSTSESSWNSTSTTTVSPGMITNVTQTKPPEKTTDISDASIKFRRR